MTSRASSSASPAPAPIVMPRTAPPRRSPTTSTPAWRHSSTRAPSVPALAASLRAGRRNPVLACGPDCLVAPPSHRPRSKQSRFAKSPPISEPALVALRGKDIDLFLARPDATRPIILLYGPDAGLVRERAEALVKSAVDDPNDPFAMVRMDGDDLAAEPSRLVEEAMTIPMFGGRRAIRVRAGSKNFSSGVETLAEMPIRDCRIV